MFTVPGNPELNEAIRNEIRNSTRRLGDVVLFDWDRDGSFDHFYSDLSKAIVDVDLERASLVTDLPEDVNTIQGYSSSELTITLGGYRYSDELTMTQLLSPFNVVSPFHGARLTGVQVLYRKVVTLPDGGTYHIPQFRGTVRDISFDRKAETVTITCTDIDKWINRTATLPHWAVNFTDRTATQDLGHAARPMNAQWAVGELLAQAGTPIGPAARPDSVFFVSGNGGFVPRVGTIARQEYDEANTGLIPAQADIWIEGNYGICTNLWDNDTANYNWCNGFTSRTPSYATGQNIGFSLWSWSNGSGSSYTLSQIRSVIGNRTDLIYETLKEGTAFTVGPRNDGYDITQFLVQVTRSGQVIVKAIQVNASFQVTNGWIWSFPPIVSGWHFFDVNFAFRSGSFTCTLTVDGTVISPQATDLGTGGFTLVNPAGVNQRNFIGLLNWGGAQHFQMYNGPGAVYDPVYKDPPVDFDGIPFTNFWANLAEISWIPDLTGANIWETLGAIANAEFGVLYTNEGGTLIFRQHSTARDYSAGPVETFTADDLHNLVMNPSLDQYKNRIELAYTNRQAEFDLVYQPSDARQFLTPDNNVVIETTFALESETISSYFDAIEGITQTTWTNLQNNTSSWEWREKSMFASATMNNPANDGNGFGPVVWGYPSDDARTFTLFRRVPASASITGLFIGSGLLDGDTAEPRFRLRGMRYSDESVFWYVSQDTDEIAEHGEFTLRLEPNEWRQWHSTAQAITPEILKDTVIPAPVITNFSIPTDPRLQLLDVIRITTGSFFTGQILAQIVGIRRNSRSGEDQLDLRIIATPSTWILGDAEASRLGVTTYLGD